MLVKFEKLYFKKESFKNFWILAKTDKCKIIGTINWIPQKNEMIEIEGDWTIFHGEKQFKITYAKPHLPKNEKNSLHYACSLTPGFGEKMADKIWNAKKNLWTELEVGEIPGATENKISKFRKTIEFLQMNQSQTEAIEFLLEHDITIKTAEKAWEAWGRNVISKVLNNPYELTVLPNVSFLNIDKNREKFNIKKNDPDRIIAGIKYAYYQITADGSTITSWKKLLAYTYDLINVDKEKIAKTTSLLAENGVLFVLDTDLKPQISFKNDYENEKIIMDYLL